VRGHVRRRGANSFELKFDVGCDGGQRRTVYRSFKGTRRAAQAELARQLARTADGGHVDASKLTVGQHLRERLAHWRAMGTISPKTEQGYDELLKNQILPHLGAVPLQKLTARDIERWHAALLTSGRKGPSGRPSRGGVSPRTVGHAHRILNKALREAVRFELVLRNVCAAQRTPKIVPVEMHILSPAQVKEFPAVLDGHAFAAPAVTALFTGLRRGEILALRWGNVDLTAKLLKVRESLEQTKAGLRFKPPKSRAGVRDVALPDIVVEVLRGQRKRLLERRLLLGQGKLGDSDLVFPAWDGSPQGPEAFSAAWARFAQEHELGVTFHELRHTHASQLIDAGVPLPEIAHRLGHSSPAITLSTYAHLFRKDDSKAAKAINDALNGA
jgi:integrase